MDTSTPDVAALAKLRDPFPPEQIGKLPKPLRKDSQKGRCSECGGYHGLPAIHLDYVGHAALTARLLDVDPLWNWEPFALDERGLPAIVERNGQAELWIRLTVAGMTRDGVGTAQTGKTEVSKELIGDALRNAAMRFGCALELWSKEDLAGVNDDDTVPEPRGTPRASSARPDSPPAAPPEAPEDAWAKLLKLLEEDPAEGTIKIIEVRVRALYEAMATVGLWSPRAFHAMLDKHFDAKHFGDLARKERMIEFSTMSFEAAKAKVEEAPA